MTFTRRSFLVRGLSATLPMVGAGSLLAACGGSSGSSSTATGAPGTSSGGGGTGVPEGGWTLVQRFPNTSLVPGRVRLPLSLADASGTLVTAGPEQLNGRIADIDGAVVAELTAQRHSIGDGAPLYWTFETDLDTPGIYALDVEGSAGMPAAFQLFDPAEVLIPSAGQPLPGFDTPTTDDARGVDPICTLSPEPCPFHAVTLTEALTLGTPVVYLIGTPAHCATGTCGPGLEFLVDVAGDYEGRVTIVHAEVYADDAATEIAPAVTAIGTDYEPLLFITDGDGVVRERIDIVWDTDELRAALDRNLA